MPAIETTLVIGGINADEIVWLDEAPTDDSTVQVQSRRRSLGGHAANCAIALARLGGQVSIAGAVGDDIEGASCLQALQAQGVDTAHVLTCAGVATGRVLIPQAPGLRFMMMDRGANDLLTGTWAAALPLERFNAVVIFDPPLQALDALLTRRVTGQRLLWSPGGLLCKRTPDSPRLDAFDDVIFNLTEARTWFECDPLEEVFDPAGGGAPAPHRLIVTLGAKGAVVWQGSDRMTVNAFPVDVRDPTGAGDAFVAGFVRTAAFRSEEGQLPLSARMAFANLTGGLAAERPGAQGSLPTLEDLMLRARRFDVDLGWDVG